MDELEERVPGFDQQLKLHIAGCMNSCAQHWIANIGLDGKKIKHEGQMIDAHYFPKPGAVDEFQRLARSVGYRCGATGVPDAISRLLHTYLANRFPNVNLRAYFSRVSDEKLRAQLAGSAESRATGDLSTGQVPALKGN